MRRLSVCQKPCAESNPPESGRGSSRGRQPASSGIECPECLAWQGVQRAQRGLFRRAAVGKYWHFFRLSEKSLDFFDSLRGGAVRRLSVCQKTCAESNSPESGRGSSTGRQPASSGIQCPERLAWQGVQRAQRGLFRRAAVGKYWHFFRLSEKSLDFFDSLGTEAAASVPFLQKVSMGCHNF